MAGLEGAIARLRDTDARRSDIPAYVALGEALHWVFAVDDTLAGRKQPDRKKYFEARNNSQLGKVVAGMAYVRNLAVHQLAVVGGFHGAVYPSHDLYPRDDLYPSAGVLTWRPFDDLPVPDEPEKNERDDHYRRLLAGKPVLDGLEAARRYLARAPQHDLGGQAFK